MIEKTERNKELYEKSKKGYTVRELGAMYGISGAMASFIINREESKNKMKFEWGNLSRRTILILHRKKIKSLRKAQSKTDKELLRIKNIDKVTLAEIRNATLE